jgi:gamma-glutamyltranspeptidase/glutathione hydrolase
MVDAALVSLKEFGTRTFAEVAAPAIELADGFPIDETRAMTIYSTRDILIAWPESRAVFLPSGRLPRTGDIFRQPNLARTLRAMAQAERGATREKAIDAVRDFFYRGDIARRISAFSEANGGLLRYEDFAAFRADVEQPVCEVYRGTTVCKPGFWTQGPAMIETLNLIEMFNLSQLRWNSPQYIHIITEAFKLAYADRDTWYGDPKFTPAPLPLLSKEYAQSRRALIGDNASLEFTPGTIQGREAKHPSLTKTGEMKIDDALMARDTTCVIAMDEDGNVFSATPSGAWLPSVIAGDTGIPLTQRAQSFLLVPGHPNELAGGKRPRVTLSPTLVLRDGKALAALSTPGGDNQDQALLQVLLNVLEFNMNAQQAVEAPRFQTRHLVSSFDNHGMNIGDLLLDERIPQQTFDDLAARGHKARRRTRYASGSAPVLIRLTPSGVIEAGADPYGYRSARAW